MRRKNRKYKQEDSETTISSKTEGSEVDNLNEENHDENIDNNSETPEPETKKRKSEKRVSLSSKKASKERKDREEKENSQTKDVDNGDIQYEVESIVDEKFVKGVKHYLIRWKGFDEDSDTWEPENTLNCAELVRQFHNNQKNSTTLKSKKIKNYKKKSMKKNDIKRKDSLDWDENEEFEVDRIIEVHHKRDGKREFLVSWKGYPQSQNSWVLEEDMTCNDLIARFMAKVERAREAEQKNLRVKPAHTDRFTLATAEQGRRLSKRNSGKQRVQYHDAE